MIQTMVVTSFLPIKTHSLASRPKERFMFSFLAVALLFLIVSCCQWPTLTRLTSGSSSLNDVDRVTTDTGISGIHEPLPEIAWLLSFPNSGTSYTLALIESASNRSIASNYGMEFSNKHYPEPLPVYPQYPQGPFWEGLESDVRFSTTVRSLPDHYILTKTHCGGRCIKCTASSYLQNATTFLDACKRTTFRQKSDDSSEQAQNQEGTIDETRVARAVHLIRNPLHNVVSRFHLEAKHWNKKKQGLTDYHKLMIPINATGFRQYCSRLDKSSSLDAEFDYIWSTIAKEWPASKYRPADSKKVKGWFRLIPCRAEFVKYVKWHDHILHSVLPALGPNPFSKPVPAYTLYYEDYGHDLPYITRRVLEFLQLPNVIKNESNYRPFRISNYDDHYEKHEKQAIALLLRAMATPETWRRIRHYVRDWFV